MHLLLRNLSSRRRAAEKAGRQASGDIYTVYRDVCIIPN